MTAPIVAPPEEIRALIRDKATFEELLERQAADLAAAARLEARLAEARLQTQDKIRAIELRLKEARAEEVAR